MVACKMPAGILQVVQVNSPVQVLADRGALEGAERQVSRRCEQGLGGGNWAALKEGVTNAQSDIRSQAPLLARQCQQAAALTLPAHLVNLALIQRSWVPVNPRMVLVRQNSTKATPLSAFLAYSVMVRSHLQRTNTGGYCIDYLQNIFAGQGAACSTESSERGSQCASD